LEAPWWQGISVIVAILLFVISLIAQIIKNKINKRNSFQPDWVYEKIEISSINYLNDPITIEFRNNGSEVTNIKVEYHPHNSNDVIPANFFCKNPFIHHKAILRFTFSSDFPNPSQGNLIIICSTKNGYISTSNFLLMLSLDEANHRRLEISPCISKKIKKNKAKLKA
jgi:hypothetical protein